MITGKSPQKFRLLRLENGQVVSEFVFQYNPPGLEENYSPNWSFERSPGNTLPWAIFNGLDENIISFTVLLDATETYRSSLSGVDAYLDFFRGLTIPDSGRYLAGARNYAAPPEVILQMGPQEFKAVMTSLNIRILRWNRNLHPTRAEVDVSFKRYLQNDYDVEVWMWTLNNSREDVEVKRQGSKK